LPPTADITASHVQRYCCALPPSASGMTPLAFSLSRAAKNSSLISVGALSTPAFLSTGML
jgi:hypothetical protein